MPKFKCKPDSGEGALSLQGETQKYISRTEKSILRHSVIICTLYLKVTMMAYGIRREIFK